jgi:hypothetical protein
MSGVDVNARIELIGRAYDHAIEERDRLASLLAEREQDVADREEEVEFEHAQREKAERLLAEREAERVEVADEAQALTTALISTEIGRMWPDASYARRAYALLERLAAVPATKEET